MKLSLLFLLWEPSLAFLSTVPVSLKVWMTYWTVLNGTPIVSEIVLLSMCARWRSTMRLHRVAILKGVEKVDFFFLPRLVLNKTGFVISSTYFEFSKEN